MKIIKKLCVFFMVILLIIVQVTLMNSKNVFANSDDDIQLTIYESGSKENLSYNNLDLFNRNFRDDLSKTTAIEIDYKDFCEIDKDSILELVDNGIKVIIKTNSEEEICGVRNNYITSDYYVDCNMDKITHIYIYQITMV